MPGAERGVRRFGRPPAAVDQPPTPRTPTIRAACEMMIAVQVFELADEDCADDGRCRDRGRGAPPRTPSRRGRLHGAGHRDRRDAWRRGGDRHGDAAAALSPGRGVVTRRDAGPAARSGARRRSKRALPVRPRADTSSARQEKSRR